MRVISTIIDIITISFMLTVTVLFSFIDIANRIKSYDNHAIDDRSCPQYYDTKTFALSWYTVSQFRDNIAILSNFNQVLCKWNRCILIDNNNVLL